MDFSSKLPYARDRIVECCFWTLTVYFEPQYSRARKMLPKINVMLSLIDDTYDSYGTIDELELFTEAIERFFDIFIDAYNSITFIFSVYLFFKKKWKWL